MKNFLVLIKLLIFVFIFFQTILVVKAQDRCDETVTVYGHPEELPIFRKNVKSSIEEMLTFLVENLKYPQSALEDEIEGKVYISFWIDTAGNTQNHRIVRGVREDLDREALRVAKLIKFDEPAKNLGKPIGDCFTIPILFRLPEK